MLISLAETAAVRNYITAYYSKLANHAGMLSPELRSISTGHFNSVPITLLCLQLILLIHIRDMLQDIISIMKS
jgi:hypothetical protein